MFANWKSAVYEYVYRRNRQELEYDTESLAPFVRDDAHLRRLAARLKRLKAVNRSRGVVPVRSETGLKIGNVDSDGPRLTVDLILRRNVEYDLGSRRHGEERIERERLELVRHGADWIIARVEPEVPERQEPESSAEAAIVVPEHADIDEQGVRTRPYLNQQLFSRRPDASPRAGTYDRRKAKQYADTWWNGANPEYVHMGVDCTNFVSQCLFAGGAPMNYTGKRESGWWYRGLVDKREQWSFSWSVAHSLQSYLTQSRTGLRAQAVSSPLELTVGDVIQYDWEGDGRYSHSAIVTAEDAAGMPLVNAHTTDCRRRYWDYRDSYAWTPNTRYRFLRIVDHF